METIPLIKTKRRIIRELLKPNGIYDLPVDLIVTKVSKFDLTKGLQQMVVQKIKEFLIGLQLSMAVNVSNGKVDYVKCEINVGKPWECVPFLKNYANTFYGLRNTNQKLSLLFLLVIVCLLVILCLLVFLISIFTMFVSDIMFVSYRNFYFCYVCC